MFKVSPMQVQPTWQSPEVEQMWRLQKYGQIGISAVKVCLAQLIENGTLADVPQKEVSGTTIFQPSITEELLQVIVKNHDEYLASLPPTREEVAELLRTAKETMTFLTSHNREGNFAVPQKLLAEADENFQDLLGSSVNGSADFGPIKEKVENAVESAQGVVFNTLTERLNLLAPSIGYQKAAKGIIEQAFAEKNPTKARHILEQGIRTFRAAGAEYPQQKEAPSRGPSVREKTEESRYTKRGGGQRRQARR